MTFKILTFCGSLRTASSNLALLMAAERLAPEGLSLQRYDGVAALPHFSPDLDAEDRLPEIIRTLRGQVADADGLLFAVPEYMHGLPGSFKNALDWMVGCTQFPGKPVALAHVSDRHAYAPGQLEEVLRTMSASIIPEAGFSLSLATNDVTPDGIYADAVLAERIASALGLFHVRLSNRQQPR